MRSLLRTAMIVSALVALHGCYSEEAAYPGEVDDGNADLVEVSPGVEVIADWNEPIFFADDFYWVNRGGFWYRSGWYGGGWVRAEGVPEHIRVIAHPEGYAHYRPAGFVHHEPVHGGYTSHAQYHASHAASGGVRVRAATHAGGRRR